MEISLVAYVKGSREAVDFYKHVFDAELGYNYPNEDGSYMHAEIVKDQKTILAVGETDEWTDCGHAMQFGVNLGSIEAVQHAYEILSQDAEVLYEIAPSFYNEMMFDLVDRYGIRWCIAV